jgi:hypothetical protein
MPRSLELLRSDLMDMEEIDFNLDHPDADGIEKLNAVCNALAAHPVDAVAPLILSFIEKLAEPVKIDARYDLGTPGPLVHTLEALPGYERWLIESVRRRPAPLSLWMLNRILNSLPDGQQHDRCFAVLRSECDRSDVGPTTVAEATEFLEHQKALRVGRSGRGDA